MDTTAGQAPDRAVWGVATAEGAHVTLAQFIDSHPAESALVGVVVVILYLVL